jgi:hypothetical protein
MGQVSFFRCGQKQRHSELSDALLTDFYQNTVEDGSEFWEPTMKFKYNLIKNEFKRDVSR